VSVRAFDVGKAGSSWLGIGTAETLRKWVRQAEIGQGQAPGVTTGEAQQVRDLKRKVAEMEATLLILVEATRFLPGRATRYGGDRPVH
jgi:transposase